MNWSDIKAAVGDAAPILGTLVGGPAGAAIGSLVSSALGVKAEPSAVAEALKTDPAAAVKLKELEVNQTVQLQTLLVQSEANRLASDTAGIQSVNGTMQAEAKADHWPTYTWRPFVGFVFGTMMLGVYFVLPLLHTPVPTVPTEAWVAMGAVLGVASWFRGKAQADPAINNDMRG